jgi:DNA (cytosine-5)-methyltransferase 1
VWFVADTDGPRLGSGRPGETRHRRDTARQQPSGLCDAGDVADPNGRESSDPRVRRSWRQLQLPADPLADLWANADWIPCQDGKWRPVEPGTFPLAHGAPARLGRLRGYGNAINPVVAADVIKAYMSARGI